MTICFMYRAHPSTCLSMHQSMCLSINVSVRCNVWRQIKWTYFQENKSWESSRLQGVQDPTKERVHFDNKKQTAWQNTEQTNKPKPIMASFKLMVMWNHLWCHKFLDLSLQAICSVICHGLEAKLQRSNRHILHK